MKNSKWFSNVLTFTIGWVISLFLWRLIRVDGLKTYLEALRLEFSTFNFIMLILGFSLITGLIFGSVQFYHEQVSLKKSSYKYLLIRAFVSHFIIMLFLYSVLFLVMHYYSNNLNISFKDYIRNPTILINLVYSLVTNTLIVITLYLNKLIGKGNLFKLITGKFYHPKEESRVFMFLDLQSSTTIAETLGHLKYSQFIQDCFYDISVFEGSNAAVYQYVGDEVVLTWDMDNNQNFNSILEGFFLFKARLHSRHTYYERNYKVLPVFKAGMHCGPVTAVEVGSIKREIAYHGDTLNIASRIQDLCNTFKRDFLISGAMIQLIDKVNPENPFVFTKEKEVILKGKEKPTVIYSVAKK